MGAEGRLLSAGDGRWKVQAQAVWMAEMKGRTDL